MFTIKDIYISFRRQRAYFFGKKYYTPQKDSEGKISLLVPDNCIYLKTIMDFINTNHLDPELYFKYGFEVFGVKFSYPLFTHSNIMLVYNERKEANNKKNEVIIQSFKRSSIFVLDYMKDEKLRISKFLSYGFKEIEGLSAPIYHYKQGYICKYFLAWMTWKHFISLENNPIKCIYRDLIEDMKGTYTIPL